jgi:hypothetical protein
VRHPTANSYWSSLSSSFQQKMHFPFPTETIYDRPYLYIGWYRNIFIGYFCKRSKFILVIKSWIRIHLLYSSVVDPNSFFFGFGYRIFFCHNRIPRLIFWHDNFQKSGSHCGIACIPEPVKQKKKFCHRKNIHFVLFLVFNLWFFGIIFIAVFGSESKLSDSDPQHCCTVQYLPVP